MSKPAAPRGAADSGVTASTASDRALLTVEADDLR